MFHVSPHFEHKALTADKTHVYNYQYGAQRFCVVVLRFYEKRLFTSTWRR